MLHLALLCHLSAVSALATNVACLPYKSNEALLDLSGATLLHNNLGGVAGAYCAESQAQSPPREPSGCSSDMSGLPASSGCAGKAVDDVCYRGVVFGNVFASQSTSAIFPDGGPNGDPTQVDLYIENITYYYNADGGDHHLQTRINGKFAQINLDGPNNDLRGTADYNTAHETTFKFE